MLAATREQSFCLYLGKVMMGVPDQRTLEQSSQHAFPSAADEAPTLHWSYVHRPNRNIFSFDAGDSILEHGLLL